MGLFDIIEHIRKYYLGSSVLLLFIALVIGRVASDVGFEISKDNTRYLLSTISQTIAAMFALSAAVLIFRLTYLLGEKEESKLLDTLNPPTPDEMKEIKNRVNEKIAETKKIAIFPVLISMITIIVSITLLSVLDYLYLPNSDSKLLGKGYFLISGAVVLAVASVSWIAYVMYNSLTLGVDR